MPDVLVCIFQRGAADGLNSLAPYGDDDYYALRPSIAIPRPGEQDGAIALDSFFGVYPTAGALKTLFDTGRLAAVHATGFPHGTRSHFDAQARLETGSASGPITDTGWLGRHLAATSSSADRPFRAVSISGSVALSLQGANEPLAVDSLANFGLGDLGDSGYDATLAALYSPDRPFANVANAALVAINELALADPTQFQPANGAMYPQSQLGGGLLQAAQLIKADLGVEVICLDVGDWDHHENLPSVLPGSMGDLADSLLAFDTDMGNAMSNVSVVVHTEFGRRARDNISNGTDHGTGGAMWLLGGGVIGGQVATSWPGLKPADLFQNEDLAISIDMRDVLVQLLTRRMDNANADQIFPGYVPGFVPELFMM